MKPKLETRNAKLPPERAAVIARCPRCGEPVQRGRCTNVIKCAYLLPAARSLETRPGKAAVTLIELLVVLAIIGLLAALALPVAVRAFKDAKRDLIRLQRGHNATLELFARDEREEENDPRLRAIRQRQELNWTGGR